MIPVELLAAWVVSTWARFRRDPMDDPERGDVPGWVMVTVMTAGLVVVIFTLFKARITDAIGNALDSVTNTTSSK